MRNHFGSMAAAAILTCLPASSDAAPACGDTVGGPGMTFVLDGNVGPCPGTAIFLAPGTVAFDLAGFTISCSPWGPDDNQWGVWAYDVKNPVQIRNGTITGCRGAVMGELDSRIVNMTLIGGEGGFNGGSCESSIAMDTLYSGMGLHRGASRDCHAFDNGQTGIALFTYNGDKASLSDSSASGNGINGISAYTGDVTFNNCVAEDNGEDGFMIFANGPAKLTDCISSGNVRYGYRLATSDDRLKVNGSVAVGNGDDGFYLQNGNIRLSGNEASGNGDAGIFASQFVDKGRIKNNEALDNLMDLADETADCAKVRWRYNTFGSHNQYCIQ